MRNKSFLTSLLVVSFVIAALFPGQTARADTFTVTITIDGGVGSLRWAIDQANANPGADTITFAPCPEPRAKTPMTAATWTYSMAAT